MTQTCLNALTSVSICPFEKRHPRKSFEKGTSLLLSPFKLVLKKVASRSIVYRLSVVERMAQHTNYSKHLKAMFVVILVVHINLLSNTEGFYNLRRNSQILKRRIAADYDYEMKLNRLLNTVEPLMLAYERMPVGPPRHSRMDSYNSIDVNDASFNPTAHYRPHQTANKLQVKLTTACCNLRTL